MHDAIITILGCGDGAGVPRVGNVWGNCDPNEPRNIRSRPSIAIQRGATNLIVDTGVDFSHQLTRAEIKEITAILYTHSHSDHVNGIDDIRFVAGRMKQKIPVYADQQTYDELYLRFRYIFEQISPYYPAVVDVHRLDDGAFGTLHQIGDITYVPFLQDHGQGGRSLGFRFGDVGYSTDMANLDEKALTALKGIKVWIADCADFHTPDHYLFHSNLPNVQRLNEIIGAETVYLTHLRHLHDYGTMMKTCPTGYYPAYDGLRIRSDGTVL